MNTTLNAEEPKIKQEVWQIILEVNKLWTVDNKDKGQLVVLANGFQKKTQKNPKNEIELALKIKAEYEK